MRIPIKHEFCLQDEYYLTFFFDIYSGIKETIYKVNVFPLNDPYSSIQGPDNLKKNLLFVYATICARCSV